MGIQPGGALQETCTYSVLVAKGVSVTIPGRVAVAVADSARRGKAVLVAVGKSSEIVGRIGVGVAWAGRVSARASEMPPMTSNTDMMAMITPPPN
jgi:hypothetical protein